jgi:phage tail sheath protein FI
MPEYLAPGVFVEETRFRSKGIEGVGTSTAGFVGMSRRGVAGSGASRVPSVAEFERQLGSAGDFQIQPSVNYLAPRCGRSSRKEGGGSGWRRWFLQGIDRLAVPC